MGKKNPAFDSDNRVKAWKRFCLFIGGGFLIVSLFLTSSITILAAGQDVQVSSDQDDGIPKDLKEIFEKVGEEYEICPELLEAMAYNESRFIPTVTNGKHYGLMQVNIKIHAARIERLGYTAEDMLKAEPNIRVAADYLKELFDTYGDDDPLVLMYYSGNKKQIPKYKEYGFLCPYVSRTLKRAADYERKHGK